MLEIVRFLRLRQSPGVQLGHGEVLDGAARVADAEGAGGDPAHRRRADDADLPAPAPVKRWTLKEESNHCNCKVQGQLLVKKDKNFGQNLANVPFFASAALMMARVCCSGTPSAMIAMVLSCGQSMASRVDS